MGIVDVAVAASGISLQLQFQPMVAKTNEKDIDIMSVHSQMFYDLAYQWFPTYERLSFEGLAINPRIGGKIPIDRVAKLTELDNMLDRGVISAAFYRLEAGKLGYVFPENIAEDIAAEQASKAAAEAAADPFAARVNQELGANADAAAGTATA